MFGNVAIYVGDKIVLATRQKEENPVDNGIWVGTKVEYHEALFKLFPSLRKLETYKIKSWLLLPDSAEDFESTAADLAALIKQNSPLIGNIPQPRKKKKP
ncbi:MAG: hypothetical protein AAF039_15210 [Bacteroidota bacterium]